MRKFRVTINGETFQVEVEEVEEGRPAWPASGALAAQPPPAPLPGAGGAAPAATSGAPAASPVPAGGTGAAAEAARPQGGGAPAAARAGRRERAGAEVVRAPLPGTILLIKVTQGAQVKAGQVLLVLEAMKMQNEIVAPRAGRVKQLYVSPGDSVSLDEALLSIE
ncbi:MAG: biotin/lipoyl-binding protein [Acetobacteraceae bacterium]|nr:biotin/lipoyl-binding protein [Acetobacteraceae bacterium]